MPDIDFVAWGFVYRQAFACHRRLINGTLAQGHDTIQRNAFARSDTHYRAHCNRFDPNPTPATVGLTHFSLLRCKCQQALDGVARPIYGPRLNGFGNRV